MKLIYEASVKVKIVLDSNGKEIGTGNIPTQDGIDNSIKELIKNGIGNDGSCEIEISSKCDKECCKYCKGLRFYNGYFCDIQVAINSIPYIKNIEKDCCTCFGKREEKFWNYEGAEF